jgi:hypothetical protein
MEVQGVPVRLGRVYHKKKMQTMGVHVSAIIISLSSSPTPAADFLSSTDLRLPGSAGAALAHSQDRHLQGEDRADRAGPFRLWR